MTVLVYLVPGQTDERRKDFLEWENHSLWGEEVMLTVIKVFMILFLLEEIGNILAIFKINK